MKVFFAAIILVGICVLLLSVGILMHRGFPQFDVGSNEKLRARGITCFKDEDAALHRPLKCSGNFSDACAECSLYSTGPSAGGFTARKSGAAAGVSAAKATRASASELRSDAEQCSGQTGENSPLSS